MILFHPDIPKCFFQCLESEPSTYIGSFFSDRVIHIPTQYNKELIMYKISVPVQHFVTHPNPYFLNLGLNKVAEVGISSKSTFASHALL